MDSQEKLSSIEALILTWEQKDHLNDHIKTFQKIEEKIDWLDALEKQSVKLQRRVSGIVKVLGFKEESSPIFKAIKHFRESEITSKSPCDFLKEKERKALLKGGSFRVSLYKVLLFVRIVEAIRSGELNLVHSYRYKSLQKYLIPDHIWEPNKDNFLKENGLEKFKNFHEVMANLEKILAKKYKEVNEGIKDNPYLTIDEEGKANVKTPKIDNDDLEYISFLLKDSGQPSVYQILVTIEEVVGFSKAFQHFSLKHSKMKPSFKMLSAGIMALGLNHGTHQMAKISEGVTEKVLRNTINWFFTLKNIDKANGMIVSIIDSLVLSGVYNIPGQTLVTGSDGRKVPVRVDSLNANYSYKYPGKGKVVSVYSFLDNKQRLYYSTVISAAEREAPHVIDGITHNDSIKSSFHSTDTFGYTEQIFGTMSFIGVAYAPRFKKIKNQRLYAFDKRKDYVKKGYKILPSRGLNLPIMEANWDILLRFIATIKSKYTSASQLFKRLSSYAKDNPLYKALKEFGRIHKTIYILSYFQDKELRQLVQKTLNRVEQSNKFTKAIAFGNNQEFLYGTKEEQDVAIGCTTLIQNASVLWNYLYISRKVLETKDPKEQKKMVRKVKKGSFMCWKHLNFHGEYNFSKSIIKKNMFDIEKLRKLKI